jgi:hypothetical protein
VVGAVTIVALLTAKTGRTNGPPPAELSLVQHVKHSKIYQFCFNLNFNLTSSKFIISLVVAIYINKASR